MKVLLAVDEPHARPLADGLEREGVHVTMVLEAAALTLTADDDALYYEGERVARALADCDAVMLEVSRTTLNASVVAMCDRNAVRIIP
ncbi:MAG TPA: hypothetical protein VEX12_07015, partial [Microbacterium sp.]|nr:hypothetical protein [Microbacterium sp.]